MEFCKLCRSLMVNSSCTNRKCKNHDSRISPATIYQIDYIKDLIENAGKNEDDYNLKEITKDDASKLIEQLTVEIEDGIYEE